MTGGLILVAVLATLLAWWLWKEILFFLVIGCVVLIFIGFVVVFHQVQSLT